MRTMKKGCKGWMKRLFGGAGGFLLCFLLFAAPARAAGSDSSTPVPADAVSGGLIHSNIYGDVLITRQEDGNMNYSFFNTEIPAVQQLLAELNAGRRIDLTRLLMESATSTQSLKTNDDIAIDNDLPNLGAAANPNRGTFSSGSVYGPDLKDAELVQVQTAVSLFLTQNKVEGMSDVNKVRAAHDYLVKNCIPTSPGSRNHADNAWGALIYHEANAKGYARAMKALCDGMGIGSYVISNNGSSALKNYMWNTVMIDGNWYIVDVFCDDSTSSYATYLLSDNDYILLGLRWDMGSSVPVCKKRYGSK